MTDFAWLAALLAPREMAPHPNLDTRETLTAPSYLSAVVNVRSYGLVTEDDGVVDLPTTYSSDEYHLIQLCRRATSMSSAGQAAFELADFAIDAASRDRAIGSAASLVGAVALSDVAGPQKSIALLDQTLEVLPQARSATDRLIEIVLRIQLMMRQHEARIQGEDFREILRDLNRVKPAELEPFVVGERVSWTSAGTYKRVVHELRYVLATAFRTGFSFDSLLRNSLRLPTPALLAEAVSQGDSGWQNWVHECFDEATRSREVTWRSEDVVDTPAWRALVHFELTGNVPYARTWRRTTGELRLLRGRERGSESIIADALQLLRRSGQPKPYTRALEYVRANGPLAALRHEVLSITRLPLGSSEVNEAECKGLALGAQVLTSSEATSVLEELRFALSEPVPSSSVTSYLHPGVRLDLLLQAAAAVVAVTGDFDAFAEFLLLLPIDAADQLSDRALAHAISAIEWDEVSPSLRAAWQDRVDSLSASSESVKALTYVLSIGDAGPRAGSELRLDEIAAAVDRLMRGDIEAFDEGDLSAFSERVAGILAQTRENAARGMFSKGGVAEADVASALVLFAGAEGLWSGLVEFLLDSRVARDDKSSALRRIALNPEKVPESVRADLIEGVGSLIDQDGSNDFFGGSTINPFPEALGLASALSLLPDEVLMLDYSKLTGSRTIQARIEAARWMSLLIQSRSGSELGSWVLVLALQLSADEDATVRAYAGRALAEIRPFAKTRTRELVEQRLIELLQQDGIIAPLLVLRELSELDWQALKPLLPTMQALAESHPAHGVRLQAKAAIGQGSVDGRSHSQ